MSLLVFVVSVTSALTPTASTGITNAPIRATINTASARVVSGIFAP